MGDSLRLLPLPKRRGRFLWLLCEAANLRAKQASVRSERRSLALERCRRSELFLRRAWLLIARTASTCFHHLLGYFSYKSYCWCEFSANFVLYCYRGAERR